MKFTHKVKVAIVASVASVAIAGAAFAYFTTTGAGEGEGTVGTSTALVLTGTVDDLLYPGTSSQVSFTVDNASPGHQFLTTIHLEGVTTDDVGCPGSDFTMSDVNASQDLASADGIAVTAHGTIVMANHVGVNQDACKDAVITLDLSST